jgi:hypothetical protein
MESCNISVTTTAGRPGWMENRYHLPPEIGAQPQVLG